MKTGQLFTTVVPNSCSLIPQVKSSKLLYEKRFWCPSAAPLRSLSRYPSLGKKFSGSMFKQIKIRQDRSV